MADSETRKEIREKYRMAVLNPFRKTAIDDPAILRYQSARMFMQETYSITPRSILLPVLIVGAIVGLQMYSNKLKREEKRKINSGETTYYQRALYRTKYLY